MAGTFKTTIMLTLLIAVTFIATCGLFDSPFAEKSIDWLSFFAGTFLVAEGVYKMLKFKAPFFPNQPLRCLRIVIGLCIIAVHVVQFFWGTGSKAFEPLSTRLIIDWFAFLYGILLMCEGVIRALTAKRPAPLDQSLRAFRVAIGASVFTIHLLQFMRF